LPIIFRRLFGGFVDYADKMFGDIEIKLRFIKMQKEILSNVNFMI